MKKIFLIALLALLSFGVRAGEETEGHYYIPPTQFNAALQVMDLGFSNMFGLFRNATGSFAFDGASKKISDLKLAIDAASLTSNNPDNEGDLENMLGGRQYPEIRFTALDSTSFTDGKAEIKGTLTLHGASKPFTLDATLNHMGKSPQGGGMWSSEGDAIGLSMHGTFKRAEFGITDDPEAKSRFGDTVTLMLEPQAIRQ